MKYQLPKRLNIITALLLGITLISISNHKYVLAQNSNIVDPLCYWQTTDGRKLDLGVLCNSKSQQTTLPLLKNNKNLRIGKVILQKIAEDKPDKLIRDETQQYYRYRVIGQIINNGYTYNYLRLSYDTYDQIDGKFKIRESSQAVVYNGAIFTIDLRRSFDLLMLRYTEKGNKEIKICYSDSDEKRELCKRINPDIILRFDEDRQ